MEKILSAYRRIHMVGIKGVGMTALAEILTKRGVKITGSDTGEKFFTDQVLDRLGIAYVEGFDANNIPKNAELVIYSSMYQLEKNPELRAALEKSIPLLSYPQAVGRMTPEKLTLAVCGSHGKTTTSALLADALHFCGKDPLALVGSHILSWKGNALTGSGEYFVLEADEYQDKLAEYTPFGVLLTSIDWDHPDFFPNIESYEAAFMRFVERIPPHGFLVYSNDSASVRRIALRAHCHKISYGHLAGADFRIHDYEPVVQGFISEKHAPKQKFTLRTGEEDLGEFTLELAGRHNAMNAAAVIATAHYLKLDLERVRTALAKFSGTERRLELIGDRYGAPIYDDYAHHPEEIRATLAALRELYPDRRIRAIFQPHTFSRTEAFFSDFAQSFENADTVTLLPIYGARETPSSEETKKVNSSELANLINQFFPGKALAVEAQEELVAELEENIGRLDVVITLGAGSGWQVAKALARKGVK